MVNTTFTSVPGAPLRATAAAWAWSPYAVSLSVFYVFVCSFLRFQRRDSMHRKFYFPDRKSLAKMTNVEAQLITQYMAELEFPKIYYTSVQFALFKTYGVPTISSLLVATKQLSTPEFASKRYVDTGVLIGEFTGHHPKSERAIKALARMNYLHSGYQKSGKISQDDLLYTLSVFITEPISWVSKYEWRKMTDMEICAIGTQWKSIGDAMGIEYKGRLSKTEWVDGIDFYEDIKAWAEAYEKRVMVPAATNKQTAEETTALILYYVPKAIKPSARNLIGVLMGPMLRKAMMYPDPPASSYALAYTIFAIRKFILRYLALPRPKFMRMREIADGPDETTGRYNMTKYMTHPFYVKPGFLNRWGPEAWFTWASGGEIPGMKGDFYIPQGYLFEEVGPNAMKNKGLAEMKATEEKLRVERPSGCPFAFAG